MKKLSILLFPAVLSAIILISWYGCRPQDQNPVINPLDTTHPFIYSKTLGSNVSDLLTGVREADDRGIVMCGYTIASAFGDNDIFIMKLDPYGNIMWSNLFGGSGNDQATYLEKTSDGGFIIGGNTTSFSGTPDPFTIKIDNSGNVQWSRYYRWAMEDYSNCVIQTSDGGYIMTGYSNSFGSGGYDVYSLKLDQTGNIMWARCYGGLLNDFGNTIRETSDNGYIIGGYTFSFGALGDGFVLKLYGDGLINWTKTYGGQSFDIISDLHTASNGFIACGSTSSFGLSALGGYVFNFDNNGFIYWSRTFEGIAGSTSGFTRIVQPQGGGFVLGGVMQSSVANGGDMCLLRIFGDGAFNYEKIFGGAGTDGASALSVKSDGGFLLAGLTASFGAGSNDIYIQNLKSDGTGCLTDNPFIPGGGSPVTEVNDAAAVYFDLNYETITAGFNITSFNLLANTQCVRLP